MTEVSTAAGKVASGKQPPVAPVTLSVVLAVPLAAGECPASVGGQPARATDVKGSRRFSLHLPMLKEVVPVVIALYAIVGKRLLQRK